MNIFARIALAVLLVTPPAAGQVLDQTQSLISHTISGPYPMAQSFQPDSTFSSGAGAVVLSSDPNALFDGSTVGLTINLWDMLPNETGATWLA